MKKINTKTGNKTVRSYSLSHHTSKNGHQRLHSISETTPEDQKIKTTFLYKDTPNPSNIDILKEMKISNKGSISGDFSGNGKKDLITFNQVAPKEFYLYTNLKKSITPNNGIKVFTDRFNEIIAIKNKNSKDLITTITENRQVNFKTYAYSETDKYLKDTKTWQAPVYRSDLNCKDENSKITKVTPHKYISGDFDGDGNTDIIALGLPYNSKKCTKTSNEPKCDCFTTDYKGKDATFISLMHHNNADPIVKNIGELQHTIKENDYLITADGNGDGKTDILHFSNERLEIIHAYESISTSKIQQYI